MSAICLIDTSVFVEILNVPQMANRHDQVLEKLRAKIDYDESLFLPMATILETGNHIARYGDGRQRRACAERFAEQVRKALRGDSPFRPITFLTQSRIQHWLDEFPESALRGSGLGDLSIIHDWRRMCDQNQARTVYIWSQDAHLGSYRQESRI